MILARQLGQRSRTTKRLRAAIVWQQMATKTRTLAVFTCGEATQVWSVMQAKRCAIFSSPLGRENVLSNFGVHIILYTRFCYLLHL